MSIVNIFEYKYAKELMSQIDFILNILETQKQSLINYRKFVEVEEILKSYDSSLKELRQKKEFYLNLLRKEGKHE